MSNLAKAMRFQGRIKLSLNLCKFENPTQIWRMRWQFLILHYKLKLNLMWVIMWRIFSLMIGKGLESTQNNLYTLLHNSCHLNIFYLFIVFLVSLNTIFILTILPKALSNEKWKQAINVEMEALKKNKTWELVKLLAGKNPVECKWVYAVKYITDGSIEDIRQGW